jgi:hypothetical protein
MNATRPDNEAGDGGMRTITSAIPIAEVARMAGGRFGNLVKAVVDVRRGIMVVDAEMHADEEALLIDGGSQQASLWGINLYPAQFGTSDFIEFDSMINVRPRQGNRSRDVEDAATRQAIITIVDRLVGP